MFKNAAKVQLIFLCLFNLCILFFIYNIFNMKKACNRGEGPSPRLHAFFSIK